MTTLTKFKDTGLSYIGSVNSSAKMEKGQKYNVDTFIIYLAAAQSSGYQVCPMATKECISACLVQSGHAKIDILSGQNKITKCRTIKTQLFFENRDLFMNKLVREITNAKTKAEKKGHDFAVRLNGTSDLSPLIFKLDGKNVLELFPNVTFYDYTKVPNRTKVVDQYSNYDLTFSFSGENWNACKDVLDTNTGRVAMVFEGKLPATYKGYKVINGDLYDMRYKDEKGCIVGLKFKKVVNKIDFSVSKFIIPATDKDCKW